MTMVNEYPPPQSTLMNQPSINGNIVASDVYDYYINNELHKAIDEFWEVQYKTFTKGRIKRMRGIPNNRWSRIFKRIGLKRYTLILNMGDDLFDKTMFGITRWNKH